MYSDWSETAREPGNSRSDPSGCRLLLDNVAPGVSESDLEEVFGEVGALESACLYYDTDGRKSGLGHVVYRKEADAGSALTRLNGMLMKGRGLVIRRAEENRRAEGGERTAGTRERLPLAAKVFENFRRHLKKSGGERKVRKEMGDPDVGEAPAGDLARLLGGRLQQRRGNYSKFKVDRRLKFDERRPTAEVAAGSGSGNRTRAEGFARGRSFGNKQGGRVNERGGVKKFQGTKKMPTKEQLDSEIDRYMNTKDTMDCP